MNLMLERRLPAPPAAVWPFLVEPLLHNRWSTASMKLIAPGDRGQAGAVGAMREIRLPGPGRVALVEVVQHAEPPRRLVYRVVSGLPLRQHRGEVLLEPSSAESVLRWTVSAEFQLPGMGQLATPLLRRELGKSLDHLARAVFQEPERALLRDQVVDDDLTALFRDAEAVLEEQRALADRLTSEGDRKRWFSRVYEYVTEYQLASCREGRFSHPGWVLRLVPRFHHHYRSNLDRWIADGLCEQHWRSSFRAMEQAESWYGRLGWAYGIVKGMQAHIEEDLPRSLAEVYHWHYRQRCSYARFRSDYLLMGDIFAAASRRMLEHIPLWMRPVRASLVAPLLPELVKQRWQAKAFYDLGRERLRAFERGDRLANLMASAPIS
jgi:uncharacterized protein YndB with AHSA1/START domain